MNAQVQGGKLIHPRPKMGTCKLCGDSFPMNESDSFDTCGRWSEGTIARLPAGSPFSIVLDLRLFSKMCRLEQILKTGLEVVDEAKLPREIPKKIDKPKL